ncbi:hypothetical protein [Nocardia sp. NPDC024068]|uniref:hypothetical protein n=1 Tax=Nocardia sp. NPDC024068 TaxID=3157197 RepID=UPI0033D76D2F
MDTATADANLDTPEPASGGPRPADQRPRDPRTLAATAGPAEPHRADIRSTAAPTGKQEPGTGSGATGTTPTDGNTAKSGGLHVLGKTGPEKPYTTITLLRPPGASLELKGFIGQAESAMQQSVDVLGYGRSDPPPPPKNGRTPDKVQLAGLPGSGAGVDQYKQKVLSAGARQDSMVDMDAQVDGTSQIVAAEQAQTLFKIHHIKSDLNAALASVGPKKLKPAQEAKIMDAVAVSVTKVHDVVQAAQDVNTGAAGGGSAGGGGGAAGGGAAGGGAAGAGAAGAGGAGGGLGSILPMLAMLPMALMPMLGQLPEMLGKKDDEKEDDEDEDEAPPSQPAPSPGPSPTDPTAQAPQGAAPPPEGTPPPNQNPQQGTPQTEIPFGPTPPSKQV